ncbi:MAG: hypothetical protein RBR54_05365 [Sulfurimonas sp.]|nr:hypothetical protein [Sulfurimonas sp.]
MKLRILFSLILFINFTFSLVHELEHISHEHEHLSCEICSVNHTPFIDNTQKLTLTPPYYSYEKITPKQSLHFIHSNHSNNYPNAPPYRS